VTDEVDDAGRGVAMTIRERVLAVHPLVEVDILEAENGGFTQLVFTPANPSGVSVWVYVNYDNSVQINAGSMVAEDLEYSATLAERIDVSVRLVLSLAANGYSKVRTFWFLGPLSPSRVGPTSGFWGLDDYIGRPMSEIVESLDPWEGTGASDSD
jgi:hypothetical protein